MAMTKSKEIRDLLLDRPLPFAEIARIVGCHRSLPYRVNAQMRRPTARYALIDAEVSTATHEITRMRQDLEHLSKVVARQSEILNSLQPGGGEDRRVVSAASIIK
jgi:hypothetical protein